MKFRTKKRDPLSIEFSLKPVMSLMVALIPILLISAEFSKVSIIEATTSTQGVTDKVNKDPNTEQLHTPVVVVTDSTITIISSSQGAQSFKYQRIIGSSPYNEDYFIVKNENGTLQLSIEMESLLKQIKKDNNTAIVLSSEQSVAYATIVELMDSARRAGFLNISISRART